ncbi:MAG: hypothetical protein ACI85N_001904, partial [Gammaproteobacteria bacterium]
MTNQSINFLLIPLLFGLFPTHVYAESPIYSWRVSDLARSPVENITLRNKQDRLIKTVSAKQMVYLYAAMSSIADASEIDSAFIIVDGKLA